MSKKISPLKLKVLEDKYKKLILDHWKKTDITFTDAWCHSLDAHLLSDDDLLPGELSAHIYKIGYYAVRSAKKVYMIPEGDRGYNPQNEMPASKECLSNLKENENNGCKLLGFGINHNHRVAHEISGRHNNDSNDAFVGCFKYICRATEARNLSWRESIQCIVAVKDSSLSDETASLFVCRQYMGSSFSSHTWYELNYRGLVSEFSIHPYA